MLQLILILTSLTITFSLNTNNNYNSLRSVFGSIRLETHDLSLESFHIFQNKRITNKEIESISNNNNLNNLNNELTLHNKDKDNKDNNQAKHELHVICSESLESMNIKTFIIEHIGKDNIHTIYTSKHENSICFVSLMDQSLFEKVSLLPGVKSCTIIPTELKIHESVMYLLGLIEKDHSSFDQLNSRYHKKKIELDLSQLKLVIANGIGVPHKHISTSESYLKIEELKHVLFQSSSPQLFVSPSSHLYHLASLHTTSGLTLSNDKEHKSIWQKHAEILSNFEKETSQTNLQSSTSTTTSTTHEKDICSFSKLSIESTESSIVISQLHEVMNSETSKSCYASLLALLVTSQSVSDIRFRFPKKLFNNYIKGIIQTKSYVQTYPYTSVGLNGTGQIIGIGDTGVDEMSCFFRNEDGSLVARSTPSNPTYDLTKRKVIQYINYADGTDTVEGHGTHVSGTVAGALIGTDLTFINYNGHASGAKIAFFDMEDSKHPENGLAYPAIDEFFNCAYSAGAKLHSNSWGGAFNAYDEDTLKMDGYLVDHQDFLAVFAAGNEGNEGYYSIGDPAVSKNILTVGASMNKNNEIGDLAFFSSLGPTFDSRIKPDVVAPGYFTYSARSDGDSAETCQILEMAGTSMATPCVSGTAAQVRQYFATYNPTFNTGCSYTYGSTNLQLSTSTCNSNSNPRGATIKALLVHSGEKMDSYLTGDYETKEPNAPLSNPPDMYQGFGRVSLQNILPYPGIEDILKIHVVEATIGSLNEFSAKVQIGDSTRPFKASLVYMDPQNSVMSTKMVINNLDLIVEDPFGNTYYGNNLAGDDINNVEQVVVYTPTSGTGEWIIKVQSDVLPENGSPNSLTNLQPFSLIISSGDLTVIQTSFTNLTSYDPNSCTNSQQFVKMVLYDNGGDGWGNGNSYQIIDKTSGIIVKSGTMSSDIPNDLMIRESFCLDQGEYTVNLIQTGAKRNEMALEIGQCYLYLSEYQTTGTLSITSKTECNTCSNYLLTMTLKGSLFGIPYGWKNSSHYTIEQTIGPNISNYLFLEGTLIASPYLSHAICLSNGTYKVTMDDVPANDDFINDDQYEPFKSSLGVEEYRIFFNLNTKYKIKSSQWAIITVTGSTATITIHSPDNSSKYQLSAGGIIGLILVSIILLLAVVVVFFDTTTLINRIRSILNLPKRNNESDQVPMVESY